jgi:hypothetical protein
VGGAAGVMYGVWLLIHTHTNTHTQVILVWGAQRVSGMGCGSWYRGPSEEAMKARHKRLSNFSPVWGQGGSAINALTRGGGGGGRYSVHVEYVEDDGVGEGGKEGEEGEGGELCDAEVEALMVLYPNTVKHELLSMTGTLGRLLLYTPTHTTNIYA